MVTPLTVGSLCTGYGGLDQALTLAGWPTRLAWVADLDLAATKLLTHHHPDVPNHGDITATDWTAVAPVDIITAGYPCQPFSAAGLRKAEHDDRYIWPAVENAIRLVRPRWCLLENVRGHVGRGFAAVVARLAGLGYVGSWVCVRASDVGAPHRRERLFVLAADATGHRWDEGWTQPARQFRRPDAAQRGDSPVRPGGVDLLPTPTAVHWARNATADRADPKPDTNVNGWTLSDVAHADRWGQYAPAIAGWEQVIGRPAPDPTEPGRTGNPQLSPTFVEWLMGLPEDYVTAVPGLSRNDQLKLLGNGVVPLQGAEAVRRLAEIQACTTP